MKNAGPELRGLKEGLAGKRCSISEVLIWFLNRCGIGRINLKISFKLRCFLLKKYYLT